MNTLGTETDARTAFVQDLARAIRVQLWNDPELRAPLLSWINPTLHRWSIEETETSLMLEDMLGGAGR
jgi:hypothetical protein